MSKKFSDLSEAQKKKFHEQLEAFGISPKDVPAKVVADGTVAMHHDPELATVKTFSCHVKDLEHLKRLCGVPDKVFERQGSDAHIPYPPDLAPERTRILSSGRKQVVESALTTEEREILDSAMLAYILGNSNKIQPEYVTAINALNFPTTIAVFAADDLVITGPYPVKQSLVCGTITIEPQGYLEVIGDVSIQTQVINVVGR